ncbi:MAG: isoleucine--tRNA ligase [Elusimicrobia bacterium]|nr:isoleucine--tRNA ligase [Elusimicrobiota bacterium]
MLKSAFSMAKSYSDTVHLPRTKFPMKGDLPKREPQWLELWERMKVFDRMLEKAKGAPFVLHDGPPYANGHTHIGHALNKILKDAVVKSQALLGRRTPYIPGWDCHGLPIEHALLKEEKRSKRDVKDLVAFRHEAEKFAERFISIQRDEFRRMGVLGSWETPYTTMSRSYEAAVLGAFRRLYRDGCIYRGLKTVSWCAVCETALAEAEVEYKDKSSHSVFVALPIIRPEGQVKASVLIWTTTPWTLPANMAVAFHPDLMYAFAQLKLPQESEPRWLLLAEARLEAVRKALKAELVGRKPSCTGRALVDSGYVFETPFACHPDFPHKESRAVLADYVSAEDGTGIVHTAPGHGLDDFLTGQKYGLKILCPVDGAGRFTDEAGPLKGLQIFKDGNTRVIEELKASGRLLHHSTLSHSYPHCWRCKQPIAFRATEQWFLSVSKDGLRERLLKAIDGVRWIPAAGKERISAMVSGRPDWCLSRQRLWGTPIPMLRCAQCGEFLGDDAVLEAVEKKTAVDGSDFWFTDQERPVVLGQAPWDFAPERKCAKCGGASFRRETDILDVWVDSGASWLGVLGEKAVPCQLYLEGSDQHRGWFQSSLVLGVALSGKAPYESVLTHGFVLDDKGRAMHKSLGNVVSPQDVTSKLGADVLRLWVALADYCDDVRLSDKLLEGPTESYRKIRNTFKFLLGNVFDFDPEKDSVPYERLPEIERYVLARLAAVEKSIRQAYEDFAFRKAATAVLDFCNLDLSAFYLDARKDALYTLAAGDLVRRSAQTVMWECLLRILRLASPILSFTCEEAWQELRRGLREDLRSARTLEESVFLFEFPPAPQAWAQETLLLKWGDILRVRGSILKVLEEMRAKKAIGSSLQARAIVSAGGDALEFIRGLSAEAWAELAIVSDVEIRPFASTAEMESALKAAPERPADTPVLSCAPAEAVSVRAEKAPGSKCPRCWRYCSDRGLSQEDPELCARCVRQLTASSSR